MRTSRRSSSTCELCRERLGTWGEATPCRRRAPRLPRGRGRAVDEKPSVSDALPHPTLAALAAHRAAGSPRATALIEGERAISCAELDCLGRRAAAWLRAQGIVAGDRVALWLVNRVEWLALLLGLSRVGAALVAVNTRFRSSELEYLLERSAASMLVCQPEFRGIDFAAVLQGANPEAAKALKKIAVIGAAAGPILGKPAWPVDFARHEPDQADESDPEALALLFTTSGTTKGPKLVTHTQRSMVLHARRVARAHGFDREGATLLAHLPLCGVYGLDSTLAAFAGGAPAVLMETFDAPKAADLIRRHAVTHMYGMDQHYRMLMKAAPGQDPFPSARIFGFGATQSGGNDLALEAWKRRVPLVGLYGSSEVHALFSLQALDLPVEKRIEAGGIPASAPEAEVRIRDVDSGRLLPPGETGEMEIRAPTNFSGYLNNPEATAAAVNADGFFRTGDVGYLRGDGSYVFLTRRGDAMRLGGFLVDPTEI